MFPTNNQVYNNAINDSTSHISFKLNYIFYEEQKILNLYSKFKLAEKPFSKL